MSDETKSGSEAARKCAACGVELVPDAVFCHRCGKGASADAPMSAEELPLWKGRYSFKALAGWFALLVAWWVAMLALILFGGDLQGGGHILSKTWIRWVFIVLAVVPLKALLGMYLRNRLRESFVITSHRVVRHSGVLGRKLEELDLAKVSDVTVGQTLLQRVSNAGQVTIYSVDSSTARMELRGVAEPLRLREWIRKHAEARRRR